MLLASQHKLLEAFGKELECSICLYPMQSPMMLPCHHAFCNLCISMALDVKPQCPVCKEVSAAACGLCVLRVAI
jgi:hypothetical protein